MKEIEFDLPKKEEIELGLPYILTLKNRSESKIRVSVIDYDYKDQDQVEYDCSYGIKYSEFLRNLISTPFKVGKMRISWTCPHPIFANKQWGMDLRACQNNINGLSTQWPITVKIDPYQFQDRITDVNTTLIMNHFTNLQLTMYPDVEMTISLFPVKNFISPTFRDSIVREEKKDKKKTK